MIQLTILDGSETGPQVYREIRSLTTNNFGSFSFQIGRNPFMNEGVFSEIAWGSGGKFLKVDYDPTSSLAFSFTLGTIEFVSVPYALAAKEVVFIDASNAQDGDALIFNSASGKFEPGQLNSQVNIQAGNNISIAGNGSSSNPFLISTNSAQRTVMTESQSYEVPTGVSRIKVELWGGAGGGGGAGGYSTTISVDGGSGGTGGYVQQEIDVTPGQIFNVTVGQGGIGGSNATVYSINNLGNNDSNGQVGGDTWFGSYKAAGGQGGVKGSSYAVSVNGNPGTDNIGAITASGCCPGSNVLGPISGIQRSYLNTINFSSIPGIGGVIYLGNPINNTPPTSGENGCAAITIVN
jgi:hypothetical protein